MENPLKTLQHHGQSVWLDYICRSLIASGELGRLIENDGVRGVTSNPAIFENAITSSSDYRDLLEAANSRTPDAKALYESIAIRDIQDAADVLKPVYLQTGKHDGYVSLEVSPKLARDVRGTIEEARRLWKAVARPNIMIKVPATREGIVAIRVLVSEAININVTLLFSQDAYEQVVEAYMAGLEDRAANNEALDNIASVASFFISRIDAAVDALIAESLNTGRKDHDLLDSLRGTSGDCKRQAHLSAFSGIVRKPALACPGRPRRPDPARVVGQHGHQGSRLPRRALCRGAHRSRYRQHHAPGHARCVSRSRRCARQSLRGCEGCIRHHEAACAVGHSHEGRHGSAARIEACSFSAMHSTSCSRRWVNTSGSSSVTGSTRRKPRNLRLRTWHRRVAAQVHSLAAQLRDAH